MSHVDIPRLDYAPAKLAAQVLQVDRRVLLFGEPGSGKSTVAAALARSLAAAGRACWCIGADPGTPAFGIPGSVCLGQWRSDEWALVGFAAVCSLDAGRFRLPLVSAVRHVMTRAPTTAALLVDAPGVVRGVAGAELLTALLEACSVDAVVAMVREVRPLPLQEELQAAGVDLHVLHAAPAARRLNATQRARERTALWDAYLRDASEHRLALAALRLIGTPPPPEAAAAWIGRQVALLEGSRTVAMGEVTNAEPGTILVRMHRAAREGSLLLVRDAQRTAEGLLSTAPPFVSGTLEYVPPPDVLPQFATYIQGGPRPVARVGPVTVTLLNGVFGDPLLHLRLRHLGRSLLCDLGEAGRLPARIVHQVSDVFVSHGHIDHIGGFLWLLRSRIADLPTCRVFGPPGLARLIEGMVSGVLWDRVGERGPRFDVAELHDDRLVRFRVQAGRGAAEPLGERAAPEGLLHEEAGFRVRAATLDHRTPVLAFAFEPAMQIRVRKERLLASGFPPGPWLTELKQRVAGAERDALILLPDGSVRPTAALADELLLIAPGEKLVYATDLADTHENRIRLAALARGAHTFFCEASFVEADAEQAARTGHLTARACGEIAAAAGVGRLVPFHFSRRYEQESERIYEEVAAACSRVVVPRGILRDSRFAG